jgi:NAD(P)-dependent dehydrogenase (short-subunit alcohol dehydrogenase family)
MATVDALGSFRLDGKVAVLTGASSGLGARFARVLSGAGAKVVLAARRQERIEALAGELDDALAVACDIAEAGAPEQLVAAAVDRYGTVDIVVNNAGVTTVTPALRESPDEFRRVLEVNLVAPFALSRAAAAVMREQGRGGSIVNVASAAGFKSSPMLPQAAYVSSKTGVRGLTRELALQWARYGVRVNAIAPGMFPSEMTTDLVDNDELRTAFEQNLPLQRVGKEHELDGVLLFLASDASSYVTGQAFVVDGGGSLV